MIDLLTSIPALLGILGAVVAAFWGNSKLQRHKGRKEGKQAVADDMAEAYNDTTKEVRDAQTDIPSDPDDVLDGLRKYTKRGQGGGDT